MVLTAEEFWSRKGQISEEEPATSAEAIALRDFIEQRSEAATAARELLSTREDETALDGKLNRVGYLVSDAVAQFPEAHARMTDLLLALQTMKPEEMGWTEDQKKRFPDWDRWIEYDETGTHLVEFRETYRAKSMEPDEDEGETLDDTFFRYQNINSFFAHLFLKSKNLYDLEYGIVRIREALERRSTNFDSEVPVAAQYFIITGKDIYQWTNKRDAFSSALPVDDTKSDLWDGAAGFSLERWSFWKQRLQTIGQEHGLRDDTRRWIRKALSAMQHVESSS